MGLNIIYRDDRFIAVHKPPGLMVHRSERKRQGAFALQMLRDQVGQTVYPVHRLDKPTSGVLLFALDGEAAGAVQKLFKAYQVRKRYLAVVRSWPEDEGLIDHPLSGDDDREPLQALTHFRCLAKIQVEVPIGKFPTSRYSLVAVVPITGRSHQIRRHLAREACPVLGDSWHGDLRHNRYFRESFHVGRLLLVACAMDFVHPFSGEQLELRTAPEPDFRKVCAHFGWSEALDTALCGKGWPDPDPNLNALGLHL